MKDIYIKNGLFFKQNFNCIQIKQLSAAYLKHIEEKVKELEDFKKGKRIITTLDSNVVGMKHNLAIKLDTFIQRNNFTEALLYYDEHETEFQANDKLAATRDKYEGGILLVLLMKFLRCITFQSTHSEMMGDALHRMNETASYYINSNL